MGKVIGITQSYSGDLVQFSTVKGGDITSLNVPISPEQDLHGYSKPWAAGAWNDLCPLGVVDGRVDGNVTFTENADGSVHAQGTATTECFSAGGSTYATADSRALFASPAGTYTIKNFGSLAVYVVYRNADNTAAVRSASSVSSGGSVTVTLSEPTIIYMRVRVLTGQVVDDDVYAMVVSGSDAPASYEPYKNICPITGSTSLAAYRTGKNLLYRSSYSDVSSNGIDAHFNADTSIALDGTSTSAANIGFPSYGTMIDVPAGNYILSGGVSNRVYMTFYDGTDSTGTRYDNTSGDTPVTITSGHIYNMRLVVLGGTNVDNITVYPMLRPAGTDNTFAPMRKKDTYTVNWYTQAGTVYAGKFDFISGELTATMANIASYNGETIGEPWLSSLDEYTPGGTPTTGAQVVYTLTDPIAYQLSGREIAALVGANNVWANNGATVSLSVLVPATGFFGWLIKCLTNGTGVEIPLKYMRAETYSVTPDQRMEWSAERDVTGVLHRETVQNLPPKIEFNTPLMTNSDINALNSIIRNAFTNELQRNITIQFYDPERDEYWEWDCYMPDVKYQIRNVDAANHIINYEETRYAFIGY